MSDDNEENDGSPSRSEDVGTRDREGPVAPSELGERISKVISRAGVASRRDVERMIGEGRIALNGETVTTPVMLVTPSDRILVDGAPLPLKERTRLFLYHKPAGLMTTEKDPEGRDTVFAALPHGLPRVVSVGRLDLNTEGLLLLTNDGGLARLLAHPKTGWLRRYRVRAFGEITQDQLDGLKGGIEIDGMHYGPVEAKVDREQGSNMWLTLGLREGKNREVKRILEHFGLKVNRLIRISFGPFQLGELAQGAVEEVRTRTLKDQLGPELTREAKLDFAGQAQASHRRERDVHRPARFEDRHGKSGARASFDQRSDMAGAQDARALRKAEAMAQGRRSGAHRHSWRDAESWAARGDRRKDAPGRNIKHSPRPPHGAQSLADDRRHLRGGRIADRKGRSVLVERIAQDPAAGPRGGQHREEARRDGVKRDDARARGMRPASTRSGGGSFGQRGSPPLGADVLRRKTRREQGVWAPSGGEGREGQSRDESRNERWKPKGGRHAPPSRDHGSGARGAWREGGRPWQGRKDFKSPGERSIGAKPGDDRRARSKQLAQGRKPSSEGGGFGGKGAGGFKTRGEGFKPRGFDKHRGDSAGFRGGPPKSRGPNRPPRKPSR
ncbi:MAG: pseudouridine synthase [Hyphomicrobiales bacterium]|nr:pseudouridine synthase [Hyphomicrobiales bacterium]